MITDLRYAFDQIGKARTELAARNGHLTVRQYSAADESLSRAQDAIERLLEAAEEPRTELVSVPNGFPMSFDALVADLRAKGVEIAQTGEPMPSDDELDVLDVMLAERCDYCCGLCTDGICDARRALSSPEIDGGQR